MFNFTTDYVWYKVCNVGREFTFSLGGAFTKGKEIVRFVREFTTELSEQFEALQIFFIQSYIKQMILFSFLFRRCVFLQSEMSSHSLITGKILFAFSNPTPNLFIDYPLLIKIVLLVNLYSGT